jgi:hypothetical protein
MCTVLLPSGVNPIAVKNISVTSVNGLFNSYINSIFYLLKFPYLKIPFVSHTLWLLGPTLTQRKHKFCTSVTFCVYGTYLCQQTRYICSHLIYKYVTVGQRSGLCDSNTELWFPNSVSRDFKTNVFQNITNTKRRIYLHTNIPQVHHPYPQTVTDLFCCICSFLKTQFVFLFFHLHK